MHNAFWLIEELDAIKEPEDDKKTFDQVFKEQYENNLKLTKKSKEELKKTFPLFTSESTSFQMIHVLFNNNEYVFNLKFQGIHAEFVIYIELSKEVYYPKVLIFDASDGIGSGYGDEEELDNGVIAEQIEIEASFLISKGIDGWINLVKEEDISPVLLKIQKEVYDKYYTFNPKAQSEKSQVEVSSTKAKLPLRDFNAIMNHVYFRPTVKPISIMEIKELAPKTLSVQGEDFILYMVESFVHFTSIGIQFIYVNKEYQIEIIIKNIQEPFEVFLTDLPTNYTQHMIFKIGQNVDLSMYSSLRFDDTIKMMVDVSLQKIKELSIAQLDQKQNTTDFMSLADVMNMPQQLASQFYGMLFEKGVSTSVSVPTPTKQEIKEEVVKNPYLMSPKMSDRQPPPPSPLKNAYYGSNAYDNGTDEEMNLSNLFSDGLDSTSCPSFSGQGTHPKSSSINPYNQQCFVIKNLASTQGQEGIETLCAMLYRAMGIFVPDMRFLGSHLISPLVPDRFNTNFTPSHFQELALTPKHRQKLVDLYIVSVWLANWDVTGASNDNMLYSPSTKQFACIDVGGSLMLRANGQFKEYWEGDKIWEMDSAGDIWKIKDVMQKELDDFLKPTYFAGKYFANLKAWNATLPEMCLDACERIMMLFYKDYNLVRKTLEWGDLPPAKLMIYKPFYSNENVKTKEEMRDLLEVFLYLRASALYLIFAGEK
jgi:hypothetical protein